MADQHDEIEAKIKTTDDLAWLMKVIANEQSVYHYDPCGKSWHEFDHYITHLSELAIRRAQKLLGL